MLGEALAAASASALRAGELERARVLLAIALRAELADEEARLLDALRREPPSPSAAPTPVLPPLLALWRQLAPPERVGVVFCAT